MKCPACGSLNSKVIDSRMHEEGISIRRRRQCENCGKRYTTYEQIEVVSIRVVKADGTRQTFDVSKIRNGILIACEKRPVTTENIDKAIENIEKKIQENFTDEISAKVIGEYVMEELKLLDDVAYVRFASVYKKFQDVGEFQEEIDKLNLKKNN